MPSSQLHLKEDDVVRLVLDFLYTRDLHISQLSLERETGVINGKYSDDILYLRQLILDGQWDDVLEFIQPLSALEAFEANKFKYAILRHKYIELLCIKSEIKAYNDVAEIVKEQLRVLADLEKIAPSREEYSKLCLLLTLPSLTDHVQYKKWNPSNARVQCFKEVFPLVEQILPYEKKTSGTQSKCARNDRLMQLLIKGILYESCVNYCQIKATSSTEQPKEIKFSQLLHSWGIEESDLNLLSWLQSIPAETFNLPFEQWLLNVDVEKIERPSLHTSWTEHMLVTPIKPGTFPHVAMPFRRPRSAADAMTRSLRPLPDGTSRQPALMALSAVDYGPSTSCFAGFHLTGIKGMMNASVDRLFDNKNGESSIFNDLNELKSIEESKNTEATNSVEASTANSIEASRANSVEVSRVNSVEASAATTPDVQCENDSVSGPLPNAELKVASTSNKPKEDFRRNLKDYQKQKQLECDDYLRNLNSSMGALRKYQIIKMTKDENTPNTEDAPGPLVEKTEENIRPPFAEKPHLNQQQAQNMRNEGNEHYHHDTGDRTAQPRNSGHQSAQMPNARATVGSGSETEKPAFKAITTIEDTQAIRCAEFHPNGRLYAVGSNSKTLRICSYPYLGGFKEADGPSAPTVILKRTKHHKGSIYCLAWSPAGDLLATGSNDKTVKLMKFDTISDSLERQEMELTMHDGTVRDVCFIEDTTNKASLLVSAGAGDCKIYVTDCATGNPYQSLSGHTGHVLALYNWGGAMFVSGSQDKSVRFWDLRTGSSVYVIPPHAHTGHAMGSAVTSLTVESSGRLLVCGHADGSCALHDVRGSRLLQRFTPHEGDVRSVRFSIGAYYLLTAGYDGGLVLTDMQGDLTCPLPSVPVARHVDKVISARWHPEDFTFLSTSADRTAVLWAIPPS